MSTWILSLLVPFVIGALWHGLSLKIACALAGEDAPGFFKAMWVSWIGGVTGAVTGVVWSISLGALISLFVSSWLALGVGMVVQLFTIGLIYKSGLKVPLPAGLGVAGIHTVLSMAVNAALGWFAYSALIGA